MSWYRFAPVETIQSTNPARTRGIRQLMPEARRGQRPGEGQADGAAGLQHLAGEDVADLAEPAAVVAEEGPVDEVGGLDVANDRRRGDPVPADLIQVAHGSRDPLDQRSRIAAATTVVQRPSLSPTAVCGHFLGLVDHVGDLPDLALLVPRAVGVELDAQDGGEHLGGEVLGVVGGELGRLAVGVVLGEVSEGVAVARAWRRRRWRRSAGWARPWRTRSSRRGRSGPAGAA